MNKNVYKQLIALLDLIELSVEEEKFAVIRKRVLDIANEVKRAEQNT